MADGTIRIDTALDGKGIKTGLADIKKAIGSSAVIATEVKVLKDLCTGIQNTAKAYNTQLKAETLLKTSAKTNPYLNGDSVKELEDFASHLQSISTYGDEQLLPMMANLANSGRTQAQIMDIMSAAVDVASTGVVSLESAVQGLNLSYTGQIGTLGRAVPALKSLTDEQLKNGDAVKLLKENYSGMAEETTKATGSFEQMQNAAGDFKEALGTITKPTSDLWNNFWKGWYEKGIENITKLNAFLDRNTVGKNNVNNAIANALSENMDEGQQRLYFSVYASKTDDETNQAQIAYLEHLKERNKIENTYLDVLKKQQAQKKELEAYNSSNSSSSGTSSSSSASASTTEQTEKTLEDTLNKIEAEYNLKKQLGQQTDENAYHQERLNAMMSDYVDYILEGNAADETRIAKMKEEAEQIKEVSNSWEQLSAIFSTINNAVSNLSSATSNITEMLTDNVEANTSAETAALENEYSQGLISYEEYCDKKQKISEDAAEKEYEIEMWSWGIQLLQAQASTALSMIQTLADTTITSTAAKIAMMATVGALGATQLASIIASKPTKNFTNGGFVGGTSYTGDSIHAGLNSGELVANRQQQAALWRAMNGGGAGGFSQSITIENNAADSVSVGQSVSEDKLIFTVNKIVNSEMKRGTYTGSMLEANSKVNGVKYL